MRSAKRGVVSLLLVLGIAPAGLDFDGPTVAAEAATFAPAGPLPFYYDLYTFRGNGGGTMVVAAIAVPVEPLRREWRDSRVRYRLDVRFVLADTARRVVFNTQDSLFVSLPRPLSSRHLLHTYVEAQAQPSATTLQRVVVTDATTPGVGQLSQSAFPIPDYSGTELMLSDVAFGLPGVEGGWTRNGVTLALLPTSQFPESSFEVFYEVYNLPAGRSYRTDIAVESLDDADRASQVVSLWFAGEASSREDGTLAELRRVESALSAGRYRITVTVKDQVDGRVAQRSRLIDVRGWDVGTTMVRALPYTTH